MEANSSSTPSPKPEHHGLHVSTTFLFILFNTPLICFFGYVIIMRILMECGLYRRQNTQKGLDPAAVTALPLVPYGGPGRNKITEVECVICLEELEDGETVKMIPFCRHVFHPACIDAWLGVQASCPICRSTQMIIRDDDEVCLDIRSESEGDGDGGGGEVELGERSTVVEGDTCRETVGSGGGAWRSRSCSILEEGRVVLQRSTSF